MTPVGSLDSCKPTVSIMTQYMTFQIPMTDDGTQVEDLNLFLRTHRVLSVDKHFTERGWSFCVEWFDGPTSGIVPRGRTTGRIDYREVLPPETFAVFARLRETRKALSKRDGIPPFAVMTDAQLAELAKMSDPSLRKLKEIRGVGPATIERFGEELLKALIMDDAASAQTETTASEASSQAPHTTQPNLIS